MQRGNERGLYLADLKALWVKEQNFNERWYKKFDINDKNKESDVDSMVQCAYSQVPNKRGGGNNRGGGAGNGST